MFLRLQSLLVAGVFIAVGAVSQSASATDRFNVIVEIVSFKSLVDMDPSNSKDEYFLSFSADVPGVARRSLDNLFLNGAPKKKLRVGRRIVVSNVREPSRSDRTIRVSSDVSEQDVVEKKGSIFKKPKKETKYDDMGTARRDTTRDLFREADRARDGRAQETVLLTNSKYRMEIRITVIEID